MESITVVSTLKKTVNSNIVENNIQTKRRKPFKVILAKKYFKNGDLVQNAEFKF